MEKPIDLSVIVIIKNERMRTTMKEKRLHKSRCEGILNNSSRPGVRVQL